jgi:predicted ester cyclase
MNNLRKAVFVLWGILLATTLMVGISAFAQSTEEPGMDAEKAARREAFERIADEGFTQGNFDLLDEYLAEDYVVHSPFGDLNREDVKGFFGAMRAAFTDFLVVRENMVLEGDYVAMRTIVTGTFDQEFTSATGVIPPNGQPITLEIVMIFHFNDEGMVDEEWAQFDNLGFLTQLGAMPAPAS